MRRTAEDIHDEWLVLSSQAGDTDAPTPAEPDDDATHALRAAMRALSPDHRAVLDLHYLDGLGVAAIAEALNIPAAAVKSRLHHARERLRAVIESHPERIGS